MPSGRNIEQLKMNLNELYNLIDTYHWHEIKYKNTVIRLDNWSRGRWPGFPTDFIYNVEGFKLQDYYLIFNNGCINFIEPIWDDLNNINFRIIDCIEYDQTIPHFGSFITKLRLHHPDFFSKWKKNIKDIKKERHYYSKKGNK